MREVRTLIAQGYILVKICIGEKWCVCLYLDGASDVLVKRGAVPLLSRRI